MTDDSPDALYAAFEDRFRGSPYEVTRRLSVYLPILEAAGLRECDAPLLDLGSGRGEWLGLLAANGYVAKGIDLSQTFVDAGRGRGLDLVLGDALEYLGSQVEGSFGAVTSFHMVEHLPDGHVVDLLAQIHRVLRPGGVVIIETPNPENHTVGASSFHLDPTHVRPLPPALLRFLAEQAGFSAAHIARMNVDRVGVPLEQIPSEAEDSLQVNAAIFLLNQNFFAPPDYAVVAQKEGGAATIEGSEALESLCGPEPQDLGSFRQLQAEARAHQMEAEARRAAARAERSEAEALEAIERARDAFEQAARAEEETRRQEALSRAAANRAGAAYKQLSAVEASFSWRLTRPLRWAKRAASRGGGVVFGELQERHSVKDYGKITVGYPMRWLLSRPGVGPAIDKRLALVPMIDHKIRVAVHDVNAMRARPVAASDENVPDDLRELPVSARDVLEDLQRAIDYEGT